MARSRYVKPDTFADTDLAEVSIAARFLYIGLWCYMDCQGITEADTKLIKRNIFPYDDSIPLKKLEALLLELVEGNFLFSFQYGGKDFFYCPTLAKHQHFHQKEGPRFSIPAEILQASVKPKENSTSTVQAPGSHGANPLDNGEWSIENGEPRNGASTDLAETSASHPELSDSVTDWLLEKIPPAPQAIWVASYGATWVKERLKFAASWIKSNPKKAPKSDFAKFVNGWLQRDWEKYRKTIPNSPAPPKEKIVVGYLADGTPVTGNGAPG